MATRARWALAGVIVAVAIGWGSLLVATPGWGPTGTTRGLVAAAVYTIADRVCHQRPERSFHVGGAQMPVCARCTGLYLSGAVGALLALIVTGTRTRDAADDPGRVRSLLVASALPTAVSWGLEVTGLAAPSMTVRALCAVPLGAVAGWICIRAATGALR